MKKVVFSTWLICLLLITVKSFAISKPTEARRLFGYGSKADKPSISKAFFGETEGQKIYQYTLKNSKGMLVKVINYGASITDIITPDKNKEMRIETKHNASHFFIHWPGEFRNGSFHRACCQPYCE